MEIIIVPIFYFDYVDSLGAVQWPTYIFVLLTWVIIGSGNGILPVYCKAIIPNSVNPLRAKFFRGNIDIYLHFVSFLHIDMQVVEILPQIRQEPTDST